MGGAMTSHRRRALHERERQDARRITAYHEAAHARISEMLGVRVRSIALIDGGGGICKFEPARGRVEDALRIAFAGPHVQYALTGDDWTSEGDFQIAREAVAQLPVDQRQRAYEDAFAWARAAVREHWPSIDCIAAALLERGELTGSELREILSGLRFRTMTLQATPSARSDPAEHLDYAPGLRQRGRRYA
jgi:hypothetical protein